MAKSPRGPGLQVRHLRGAWTSASEAKPWKTSRKETTRVLYRTSEAKRRRERGNMNELAESQADTRQATPARQTTTSDATGLTLTTFGQLRRKRLTTAGHARKRAETPRSTELNERGHAATRSLQGPVTNGDRSTTLANQRTSGNSAERNVTVTLRKSYGKVGKVGLQICHFESTNRDCIRNVRHVSCFHRR